MKDVVWDWLPGFAAGLIPLVIFLFVSAMAAPPAKETPDQWWKHFNNGLVDHLIILGLVTSAVSTFTTFPKLFKGSKPPEGAPVLMIVVIVTLVISVSMYVLREASAAPIASLWGNGFGVIFGDAYELA
ncbi:MAG TPA: hypothetical protein VHE36_00065 [Sphingomicrobium sp.]|jgi:hypothetical protein|nr:hypothetical protein [Sphingomicrobium sp.]